MLNQIPILISLTALGVSLVTAWVTLFRRGTIKMTQPTVIFFGPDGMRTARKFAPSKVFLRTLLFATSKRGRVIESMHITLSHNETQQNFNIWVYGDSKMVRGSGPFIGEAGVSANHHFLLPQNNSGFKFCEGYYRLDVYAHILGDKRKKILFSQNLDISGEQATALEKSDAGLYFDWGPDSSRYIPHIDYRPQKLNPEEIPERLS